MSVRLSVAGSRLRLVKQRPAGDDRHEYFAEGTAALFDMSGNDPFTRQDTPGFLAEREPELLTILRRVYPRAS